MTACEVGCFCVVCSRRLRTTDDPRTCRRLDSRPDTPSTHVTDCRCSECNPEVLVLRKRPEPDLSDVVTSMPGTVPLAGHHKPWLDKRRRRRG